MSKTLNPRGIMHRFGAEVENEIAKANGFAASLCTKGYIYIRDNIHLYCSAWTDWTVIDNDTDQKYDRIETLHEAIWLADCIKHDKVPKWMETQ